MCFFNARSIIVIMLGMRCLNDSPNTVSLDKNTVALLTCAIFYNFFMSPATFYPCKSVTAYPINAFSPFKSMRLHQKLEDHMGKWVDKF